MIFCVGIIVDEVMGSWRVPCGVKMTVFIYTDLLKAYVTPGFKKKSNASIKMIFIPDNKKDKNIYLKKKDF